MPKTQKNRNYNDTQSSHHPVWQLMDGTIIVQAESDKDLTNAAILSIRATSQKSWLERLRHRAYRFIEAI